MAAWDMWTNHRPTQTKGRSVTDRQQRTVSPVGPSGGLQLGPRSLAAFSLSVTARSATRGLRSIGCDGLFRIDAR